MLDTTNNPLSNELIKSFHRIFKTGTSEATKPWFHIGDWKKLSNEVGGIETFLPKDVENEMNKLNNWYNTLSTKVFENIIEYHDRFETIHPFQDDNGRVGRLIMFRECLHNDIIPYYY